MSRVDKQLHGKAQREGGLTPSITQCFPLEVSCPSSDHLSFVERLSAWVPPIVNVISIISIT